MMIRLSALPGLVTEKHSTSYEIPANQMSIQAELQKVLDLSPKLDPKVLSQGGHSAHAHNREVSPIFLGPEKTETMLMIFLIPNIV